MIEFKLPSLGADMDDGTLIEWKVSPGQEVHKGDVVAIVDTTKAAVDLESWVEGRVHELITQPGENIAVGTVMAWFLAPGESAPPPAAQPSVQPASPAATTAAPRASPAARQRAAALGIELARVRGSGPNGVITLQDVEAAAAAATGRAPSDHAAGMRRAIAAAMARSKREIPHYYLAETVPMLAARAAPASRRNQRRLAMRMPMSR
jgi:pyruvate dehydrogenase E2 component (dihydrolipoamide acetyltransferase)